MSEPFDNDPVAELVHRDHPWLKDQTVKVVALNQQERDLISFALGVYAGGQETREERTRAYEQSLPIIEKLAGRKR